MKTSGHAGKQHSTYILGARRGALLASPIDLLTEYSYSYFRHVSCIMPSVVENFRHGIPDKGCLLFFFFYPNWNLGNNSACRTEQMWRLEYLVRNPAACSWKHPHRFWRVSAATFSLGRISPLPSAFSYRQVLQPLAILVGIHWTQPAGLVFYLPRSLQLDTVVRRGHLGAK